VDLLDAETGRRLGRVPGAADFLAWSQDGQLVAIPDAFHSAHRVTIWDVPPRKPLSWFLPLAALLAIPPAWLARRQGRRSRAVAN
jgi:hypothetical protein